MTLKLATKFKPNFQAIACAVDSGYQYAELWLDTDLLAQWESIAALAHACPIQFALHFPNSGELDDRHLSNAVSLYQSLNATAMVIHAPMLSKYGQAMSTRDPSIKLAVENHRLDPQAFEQWAINNTWLTLDVEHLWMITLENGSLERLLEFLGSFLSRFSHKLAHVHLPGYIPGYPEHRPMYCSRDMVLAVFSLLAEFSYEGLIVSEVNSQFQNREELEMDQLLYRWWLKNCESRPLDDTSPVGLTSVG